jgi:hypothetical protein
MLEEAPRLSDNRILHEEDGSGSIYAHSDLLCEAGRKGQRTADELVKQGIGRWSKVRPARFRSLAGKVEVLGVLLYTTRWAQMANNRRGVPAYPETIY